MSKIIEPFYHPLSIIHYPLLLLILFSSPAIAQMESSESPAIERAKEDYRTYLKKLKGLSAQYKEITGEIKDVIREEGIPVWDDTTGEITISHDLDLTAPAGAKDSKTRQTEKEMIVTTELPGLRRETIRVTIVDNKVLRILGQKKMDGEKVERLIELPAIAKDQGPKTKYEDGILTVWIQKA